MFVEFHEQPDTGLPFPAYRPTRPSPAPELRERGQGRVSVRTGPQLVVRGPRPTPVGASVALEMQAQPALLARHSAVPGDDRQVR